MPELALTNGIDLHYRPDTNHNSVLEKTNGGKKGFYVPVKSLDDLIANLHTVFDGDEVNVEYVQSLMESYKSNPADWKKFAKFDQYRYTRNLVDEGNGKFNLMILAWGEGHGSAVHDHADAHCFMKILQGSLSEVRFAWPKDDQTEENLKETSRKSLLLNDVCYMSDELGLHRVENTSHVEPAVSLHLYCPPFSSCSMFDQRTGHRTKCQVTFWSKYGEKQQILTNGHSVCMRSEPEDN
jgi:cysteine dioxygenase